MKKLPTLKIIIYASLQLGEVPLPPEVLLHVRSQRGEEVVAVHEDVDGGVDDGGRDRRAAGHVRRGDPVHEEDGAVVVHVEEGHVVVLAPQDEEYRVLSKLEIKC